MMFQLETENVAIEELDVDVLIVGFYKKDSYLMIQQSTDGYDEQDVNFGMDTFYIERDDQSYGGYGGVMRINLKRNLLEIELDEIGKENLQCDAVKVNFQTDSENYKMLVEKLKYIFGELLVVQ